MLLPMLLDTIWRVVVRRRGWPCRWSNIYSKQLLRVLYGSGGGAGDADKDGLSPTKDKEEQKRARSGGIPRKGSGKAKRCDSGCAAAIERKHAVK